jgi:histidinol phosphatase-like PHP family hydrolase
MRNGFAPTAVQHHHDAHSIAKLDLVRWGVAVARDGGVPKERELNALDLRRVQ